MFSSKCLNISVCAGNKPSNYTFAWPTKANLKVFKILLLAHSQTPAYSFDMC